MTPEQNENSQMPENTGDKASQEEKQEQAAEVDEAVTKLADKEPRKLMEMMSMEMTAAGNPLHRKMTSEHISEALDLAAKHDEREYELQRESKNIDHSETVSSRRYYFAAFVLVMILTVAILLLFREKPEVLVPVLTGLGGLAGGFMGGWGFANSRE